MRQHDFWLIFLKQTFFQIMEKSIILKVTKITRFEIGLNSCLWSVFCLHSFLGFISACFVSLAYFPAELENYFYRQNYRSHKVIMSLFYRKLPLINRDFTSFPSAKFSFISSNYDCWANATHRLHFFFFFISSCWAWYVLLGTHEHMIHMNAHHGQWETEQFSYNSPKLNQAWSQIKYKIPSAVKLINIIWNKQTKKLSKNEFQKIHKKFERWKHSK